MLDGLKDIVKHTQGLGFFDMVKIIGSDTEMKLETMDADKSVIMYGQMYQPMPELESTIGMSRLNVLKGCIEYQSFNKLNVLTQKNKEDEDIPVAIEFKNTDGDVSVYRFMSEAMVNEQIKVPPFKGAKWNVTVSPTREALTKMSYFSSMHGSFESTFTVRVDKDSLYFDIGQGTNDRSTVKFATGVQGPLKQWAYPLSQVLSILKLSNSSDCSMSFSDMGALKIDVDSGIGKYSYILPARQG